jgi:small conductance mechanosensitive channel
LFLEIVGLGDIAAHLLAGAGIITFVIGFAFKDIGENFLSGVLLAFKSPFGINDLIETGSVSGYVSEFNLRETIVKTPDGKDVFVPNSQILKNPLINYTVDGFLRYDFLIGIDYNCAVNEVVTSIGNCLATIPEVLKDKAPVVIIEELGVSAVNIRVYYWIDTFKSKSKSYHNTIRSKVISEVLKTINSKGYYLPADIIELKNYKDSKLIINKK